MSESAVGAAVGLPLIWLSRCEVRSDDNTPVYTVCRGPKTGGNMIGYVWRERGFSYRGKNGWNRGIRLKDFYPWQWRYCLFPDVRKEGKAHSRKQAVARLLEISNGQ